MSAEPTLKACCRPVGYVRVGHTERQQCGAERSFTRRLPVARAGHLESVASGSFKAVNYAA